MGNLVTQLLFEPSKYEFSVSHSLDPIVIVSFVFFKDFYSG